jgi:hypothetical protein
MSEQADIHTAVNMKFDDCNRKQAKVRDLPSMHTLGSGTRRKFTRFRVLVGRKRSAETGLRKKGQMRQKQPWLQKDFGARRLNAG